MAGLPRDDTDRVLETGFRGAGSAAETNGFTTTVKKENGKDTLYTMRRLKQFGAIGLGMLFILAAGCANHTAMERTSVRREAGPVKTTEMQRSKVLSLDKWTYVQVDDDRTRFDGRTSGDGYWFGLAMGDVTGDGYKDIASGKWFYRNPGGDMADVWDRVTLKDSTDLILILDVDGDPYGDIIGAGCNVQYWFEAEDAQGSAWREVKIGNLPVCNHGTSTQGYNMAQLEAGGKPEVLLHGDGIYYFKIPENPDTGNWPYVTVAEPGGNGEWLGTGDIDGDGDLDICGGYALGEGDRSGIAWWENPGDGTGNWTRHHIGDTKYWADKTIPADLNGDGHMDVVVTEEIWPGLDPDASMYWYEAPADPASTGWERHLVVTQYSMNNLDLGDLDQDGDIDIVTCEHKGNPERLQIWENNGQGYFRRHLVDFGKESHLGARLADMDEDGDLDIVSIAWNDFQYLHLWRNDAILGNGTGTVKSPPLGLQLQGDMAYQVPVTVDAGAYQRTEKPVEVSLNFTRLLSEMNVSTPFDRSSIRVVEMDTRGKLLDESVPFQFQKSDQYDPATNATGTLTFLMAGNTPAHGQRYFRVLFGVQGGYYVHPVYPKQVQFDDYIQHAGFQSYKVETPRATYFYHKKGSGFASLLDQDGNDWISFHPEGGPEGNYRGIPNIAPAEFHPGPGEGNKTSWIVEQGPIKLTFQSETQNGEWGCTWDVYPTYAQMELFKKGPEPYWILYEGTPGGRYDLTDYYVTSDGKKVDTAPFTLEHKWNGDLPDPEWVYFGDAALDRTMYYILQPSSPAMDEFWHFDEGGMTVFGFGRGPRDEGWQRLTEVPAHLTVGFAEDSSYTIVKDLVNSAYQAIETSIGKPSSWQN